MTLFDDPEGENRNSYAFSGEARSRAIAAISSFSPLTFAEQPVPGDPNIIEEHLAGRRGVHAHLLERLSLSQTLHAGVKYKRQYRAITLVHTLVSIIELRVDY
ncbi:putative acyl-CoA dehydrogenase domain protein [Mycobacterium xenopi 3993]|nr:putative acyl-CoA dehydrogenase domain protein [Mycobacterium xenopi 3993]